MPTLTYKGRTYYDRDAEPRSDAHFDVIDDHIWHKSDSAGQPPEVVYVHGEMHMWETPTNQHRLPDLILTVTEGRVRRAETADTWCARKAGWERRATLRRMTAQAEKAR